VTSCPFYYRILETRTALPARLPFPARVAQGTASGDRPAGRRLGGPDVPVKGIRLVTLWRCPSHDPTSYGYTLVRHGVLGVVPTSGPQRGTPFAPRGPVGPVPPLRRYYGALRLLAVHLAALRFLRLAIPSFRPRFVPTGSGREPWINLELVSRAPAGSRRWRRKGLPRSRETRLVIRHVPPTPV
jgi:hypothetical protein